MARLSRIVIPGYPHHVTQRGVRSMDVFHSDGERREYLMMLGEETARHEVSILVWCLMTNHVHFVAVPHTEASLAGAFGAAHRRYTRMKNFAAGVRGYLFQGRFSSCVLDESHLAAAARYVEMNPVRAGLVTVPWEYPWSSARFHMGIADYDALVTDRTLLGLVADWEDFLRPTEGCAVKKLRQATRTGRPAGDEAFVTTVERLTGRDLSKARPGRPRKRPL
jgi:putative transposase